MAILALTHILSTHTTVKIQWNLERKEKNKTQKHKIKSWVGWEFWRAAATTDIYIHTNYKHKPRFFSSTQYKNTESFSNKEKKKMNCQCWCACYQ